MAKSKPIGVRFDLEKLELIKKEQNWSFKDLAIVQMASLLPFATFYIEKKYVKNA
jgi:hypothetical protein